MTEQAAKTSLYFTEGSSDKEYHAQLSPKESGYVVTFQYGRRGQALTSGTKTANPVDFAAASKIYDKLVAEKTKKGYTPDVSGEVFQDTVAGENFSGLLPQLPQTVRLEADIDAMLSNPQFLMQEKKDGDNRQVRQVASVMEGINKRGMIVSLPMNLVEEARKLPDFLASGEIIGNKVYLFDLQELDGQDLRELPYSNRLGKLEALVADKGFEGFEVLPTARTRSDKLALVARIRAEAGEGVVFKHSSASFRIGKLAASDSDQFKWKFTEDCTVRVKKANAGKRSIEVEIDGLDGNPVAIGNVTIPTNHNIPPSGALVSVVYQHLFEDGCLFQPQYKGERTDCEGPDTLDMFKMKAKGPARKMSM